MFTVLQSFIVLSGNNVIDNLKKINKYVNNILNLQDIFIRSCFLILGTHIFSLKVYISVITDKAITKSLSQKPARIGMITGSQRVGLRVGTKTNLKKS